MAHKVPKLLMCALFCSLPAAGAWAAGAVYAMTNSVGNNQILFYHRADDGTLTLAQTIATKGGGSGAQLSPPVDSLGSQGGLILDGEHHRLFAVNTETLKENSQDCQEGTITSFLVASDGTLTYADRVLSGGLFPVSLAVRITIKGSLPYVLGGDLLYVLNAGGPGLNPACGTGPNVTGFIVNSLGFISPLYGSKGTIDPGPLDGTGSGVNCPVGGFPTPSFDCGLNPPAFPRSPAQVRFTPDGTQLVVTVKATNEIYVFPVESLGTTGAPTITQAPGPALPTFFGFTFDKREHMIVTEAFGKATSIPMGGAGAVSSFAIAKKPELAITKAGFTITNAGTLSPISASIGDGGTAACWVALEPITGQYAYVSNNLSNSISAYSVGNDGSLKLLAAIAAAGSGPNDLAVASERSASFLYALDSGTGTVAPFRINLADGSLTPLPAVGGLPVNDAAQGLAAY